MTSMTWQSRLRSSPEMLPFSVDPAKDLVELRAMTRVDYEKASFLDARLTAPPLLVTPYGELASATSGLPIACDYIFHVGHVGSTLLSRLLGTHPSVFGLREPQALRTFAQAELSGAPWRPSELDDRIATFIACYSRTWTPAQRSVVKATSLVSELAARLLSMAPDSRALLMTVQPESYLATILAGPNSRQELAQAAPARLARLHRRLGRAIWRIEDLSEGECAAMSWACEMSALTAASESAPDRVLWIDFDRFLQDVPAGLTAALAALGRAASPQDVQGMAASAYLQRYSKAPEYAYGPEWRRQALAAARLEHPDEIRRGLRWLEAAATEPALAAAFVQAEARHVA
jgi:hypothetical protein